MGLPSPVSVVLKLALLFGSLCFSVWFSRVVCCMTFTYFTPPEGALDNWSIYMTTVNECRALY